MGLVNFAEVCNFNRKFNISSNSHRQQKQQVFAVFLAVQTLLKI